MITIYEWIFGIGIGLILLCLAYAVANIIILIKDLFNDNEFWRKI